MASTLHILNEVRTLIGDPAHWTQGAMARSKFGSRVDATDGRAQCWCLDGALEKVCPPQLPDGSRGLEYQLAAMALRRATAALTNGEISSYIAINDKQEQTSGLDPHHAVITIVDLAIMAEALR